MIYIFIAYKLALEEELTSTNYTIKLDPSIFNHHIDFQLILYEKIGQFSLEFIRNTPKFYEKTSPREAKVLDDQIKWKIK